MSAWSQRDLRVLRWLHESPPEHGMLSTNWMSEGDHPALPGLRECDVHVSVETLADAGSSTTRSRTPSPVGSTGLTSKSAAPGYKRSASGRRSRCWKRPKAWEPV